MCCYIVTVMEETINILCVNCFVPFDIILNNFFVTIRLPFLILSEGITTTQKEGDNRHKRENIYRDRYISNSELSGKKTHSRRSRERFGNSLLLRKSFCFCVLLPQSHIRQDLSGCQKKEEII